jgi:hypothetical protein
MLFKKRRRMADNNGSYGDWPGEKDRAARNDLNKSKKRLARCVMLEKTGTRECPKGNIKCPAVGPK